jgi:hypothetical protein
MKYYSLLIKLIIYISLFLAFAIFNDDLLFSFVLALVFGTLSAYITDMFLDEFNIFKEKL